MPYERSPQISNGHRTHYLFSKERQIISGRPTCYPILFINEQAPLYLIPILTHKKASTGWQFIFNRNHPRHSISIRTGKHHRPTSIFFRS